MLGLKRGTVKLVPYDARWIEAFRDEQQRINLVLGEKVIDIKHIGSTSIPGMTAKPILDLMVAVASLEHYETYLAPLTELGYAFREDNREKSEHVLFVKGPEEKRTHYLKFTTLDSDFWEDHILFRDYLITHPERAEAYKQLKFSLHEKHSGQRPGYTEDKADFIKETIRLAKQEF